MENFFSSDKINDVTVIRLIFNEISLAQREELKKGMAKLMDTDSNKFVIDLTRVGFISSLVLATLVFFAKEVREKGGALKLTGVSTEAYSIFQITQLDKVFEICETEQEALESLK